MSRYILSEKEHPLATDYYYEVDHTSNDHSINIWSHSHNYYEIYIFLSGSVQILLDDHVFNVKKGDIIIIPPYCLHSLVAINKEEAYERMYLYVTETCLSTFQFNQFSLLKPLRHTVKLKRFHYNMDMDDFEIIVRAIDGMYQGKLKDYRGKEMVDRSHISQVISTVNKYILRENPFDITHETDSQISKIIKYINEHFTEDINQNLLCSHFYTNHQTITRLFKDYTTMTIHNYINLLRISKAKQLICDGVQPSKVYSLCGFSDYSTFYRTFKKIEGITPKEFSNISNANQSSIF